MSGLASLLFAALLAAPLGAQTYTIPGNTNPFLAGQPSGVSCQGDTIATAPPFLLPTAVEAGTVLRFFNVSGDANYVPGGGGPGPEGFPSCVTTSSCQGISGYTMRVTALLGVFLPGAVNPGAPPPNLSFCSDAERNFAVLQPEMFQIFFIGDGLRNDGVTLQQFVVPAGATQLYLGICDGTGWWNNSGSFTFTVEQGPGLGVSNLVGGLTAQFTVAGATPGGKVGIAYSLSGPGPQTVTAGSCGSVSFSLSSPIQLLGVFTASGAGTVQRSVHLPSGASGTSVWFHALDLPTCTLTNPLAEIVG